MRTLQIAVAAGQRGPLIVLRDETKLPPAHPLPWAELYRLAPQRQQTTLHRVHQKANAS